MEQKERELERYREMEREWKLEKEKMNEELMELREMV